MSTQKPIEWVTNPRAAGVESAAALSCFPDGVFAEARDFHRQIPGFHPSPLRSLPRLAEMIGVGGVWVKDESVRLSPIKPLTLEGAMEWISENELIEITPAHIRIRCRYLDPHKRKK